MFQKYRYDLKPIVREISPTELKRRMDSGEKLAGRVRIVSPKLGEDNFGRILIEDRNVFSQE